MKYRILILALLAAVPADSPSVRNAITAGAVADGTTDDTAALQSILDGFAKPFATGVVELPAGTYRITKPLVYRGDYGYGVRICGKASAAQPSGTVLLYDGPPGEAVLELRGCTSTTVEHLAIDCGGKARAGVAISYDADSGKGTSGVYLDHLFITGGVGPIGAAVSAGYNADGTRDARQCDKIVISNSLFVGSGQAGTTRYGCLLGWANCKNFAIRDCSFVRFGTAVKFGGSGYCIVDGYSGGGNTVADFEGATGNLEIRAGNSENSAKLFMGSVGANSGSVTISNFSWASPYAVGPLISYQGFLKLEGNYFYDASTPTSVPRVELNATPGGPFSCISNGNFYRRAVGRTPVYDTNGNPLGAPYVQSFGDYGGIEGSLERFTQPDPTTLRARDLVLSGSLDFGDGRKWSKDGLFLRADQYWTADGLYPGTGLGVKWRDFGAIVPGPNESLWFVGWSTDANGNRRAGVVVPPLKGK